MKHYVIIAGLTLLVGCESKPKVDPNAPKSPEWESCIEAIESYASCKIDEAGQLDDGIKGRVTRQMEIQRNKAQAGEDTCLAALEKLPADDPCVPE